MNIDTSKSVALNLIDAVNAVSTKVFAEGDIVFGASDVKPATDQSYENAGPNSTIQITGVPERGYKPNTVLRDYRRVPLDAPVGGALDSYTIPFDSSVEDLVARVRTDRQWHGSLTYTTAPDYPDGFGNSGDSGSLTITAQSTDPLHIGELTITFTVEDQN